MTREKIIEQAHIFKTKEPIKKEKTTGPNFDTDTFYQAQVLQLGAPKSQKARARTKFPAGQWLGSGQQKLNQKGFKKLVLLGFGYAVVILPCSQLKQ